MLTKKERQAAREAEFGARRKKEDIQHIRQEDSWSNWPVLPVKRHNRNQPHGLPDCGVLYAGRGVVVFMANMWALPKTEAEFLALKTYRYESAEAMVDDGWLVD